MVISPNNTAPVSSNPGPKPSGNAPTPDANADQAEKLRLADKLVEGIVDNPEFTKSALKQVSRGQTVKISVGDSEVIKIESQGPSFTDKAGAAIKLGVRSVFDGASDFLEQDPAIGFRIGADLAKPYAYKDIDPGIAAKADFYALPVLRGAVLGIDGYKAVNEFKDKNSSGIDKGLAALHVGTDAVGFVGALSYRGVIPVFQNQAAALTAVGVLGDVVSYAQSLAEYTHHVAHGSTPNPSVSNTGGQTPAPAPAPAPASPPTLMMT